jgi:hypothetical protein
MSDINIQQAKRRKIDLSEPYKVHINDLPKDVWDIVLKNLYSIHPKEFYKTFEVSKSWMQKSMQSRLIEVTANKSFLNFLTNGIDRSLDGNSFSINFIEQLLINTSKFNLNRFLEQRISALAVGWVLYTLSLKQSLKELYWASDTQIGETSLSDRFRIIDLFIAKFSESLRVLKLEEIPIKTEELPSLHAVKNLQELGLNGGLRRADFFEVVQNNAHSLEKLTLQLFEMSLTPSLLPKLKVLILNSGNFNFEVFSELINSCSQSLEVLKLFDIINKESLSGDAEPKNLKIPPVLRNIRTLRIEDSHICDSSVAQLFINSASFLQSIHLAYTKVLTIPQHLPSLKKVYLFKCATSSEAITELLNNAHSIESIHLSHLYFENEEHNPGPQALLEIIPAKKLSISARGFNSALISQILNACSASLEKLCIDFAEADDVPLNELKIPTSLPNLKKLIVKDDLHLELLIELLNSCRYSLQQLRMEHVIIESNNIEEPAIKFSGEFLQLRIVELLSADIESESFIQILRNSATCIEALNIIDSDFILYNLDPEEQEKMPTFFPNLKKIAAISNGTNQDLNINLNITSWLLNAAAESVQSINLGFYENFEEPDVENNFILSKPFGQLEELTLYGEKLNFSILHKLIDASQKTLKKVTFSKKAIFTTRQANITAQQLREVLIRDLPHLQIKLL